MQLAANLSWMYPSLDWAKRFGAAADDGFKAVEILLPYDHPADWYARQLASHSLALALINTPIEEGAGRLGLAAVPGAEAGFRRGFERARAVAAATGCRRIHVMAGHVAALDPSACRTTLLRNLEQALVLAEQDDLVLTLEALNRTDMPGYLYHLPSQVIGILAELHAPRLRLQFDFYHCAKESLDVGREVQAAAAWIGHVQVAGAPHRHEPDLTQPGLLDALAELPALGYDSWLGCEYQPLGLAADGLHWAGALRARGVLQ